MISEGKQKRREYLVKKKHVAYNDKYLYFFLRMTVSLTDIANQFLSKAALAQVLLAFYVGTSKNPTAVWSTEPLRVLQVNLLTK